MKNFRFYKIAIMVVLVLVIIWAVVIFKRKPLLKIIARTRGYAIGVGHDRNLTLKMLKEVMPKMEKEGFQFVFVSELVK